MWVPEDKEGAKDHRQRFEYYRGQTVSIFAHAEFMLGALLLAMQEDNRFAAEFQYKIKRKLRNFRLAFRNNLLLSEYRKDACMLVDLFEQAIDDRNAFAHGMASLDMINKTIKITELKPKPDDPWFKVESTYNLATLAQTVAQFAAISENLIVLVLNVDQKFELGLAPENYDREIFWVREQR